VDWRIDAADTGPNCTSTTVSSPTVAVQVSPQPTAQAPLLSLFPVAPGTFGEGITELMPDIVLDFNGGAPTPAGQPVPTADITVKLNVPITSRILSDPFSEALLLIDDPAAANQNPCVTPAFAPRCPLVGVGGVGINFAVPSAGINQGQLPANVYQGVDCCQ